MGTTAAGLPKKHHIVTSWREQFITLRVSGAVNWAATLLVGANSEDQPCRRRVFKVSTTSLITSAEIVLKKGNASTRSEIISVTVRSPQRCGWLRKAGCRWIGAK